jgi:hypothetical protein
MTILFPPAPSPPTPQPTAELFWLRKQTRDFIRADPRLISLWRNTFKSNGAGGFVVDELIGIFEQEMRLIPAANLNVERVDVQGTKVQPNWVLMAEYNAEMRVGDRFFMPEGQVAEIVYVQEKRAYQVKGEVIIYA